MAEEHTRRGRSKKDIPMEPRKCLMHGGLFMSEGKHNRICGDCKSGRLYQSGEDLFQNASSLTMVRKGISPNAN